jgi:hypothetical protein
VHRWRELTGGVKWVIGKAEVVVERRVIHPQ